MKITFTKKPGAKSLLLLPVFAKNQTGEKKYRRMLKDLASRKEFNGNPGESFYAYPQNVLFVGLGKPAKLSVSSVMSAFGAAAKIARAHHAKNISLILDKDLFEFAEQIASALVLANYQPGAPYKTGEAKKKMAGAVLQSMEIIVKSPAGNRDNTLQQLFKKGVAVCETVNVVRDWVNAPPNFANAEFFDLKAAEIAKRIGAKLTILKNKELQKLNMGAILGINRGAPDEARLVIFDYTPKKADSKKKPIVFVGKGILFDSGGYVLKPRGHIEEMQLDKAGAAAVFGLFNLLPLLNTDRRVIGIAPLTENLIGENAIKPSEIITTHSGKTVEVTNTDAEGRLVLCDALSYAIKEFNPECIIDIATLTGACMVALGDRYAGLFGNDKNLMRSLQRAGKNTDELLWPLPIHRDFASKMKGVYADLRNSDTGGSERFAGASKGAAFLKEFVGKTHWAHLDIAGPAFTSDPKKYDHKGATGFGVRLLAKFLEMYANRD